MEERVSCMSVEGRIESMRQELSLSEKKVADYIQKYPEQVSKMTASQIAEVSNASAPTVVRFSKKLGYKSLMDLKIALSTEKQETTDEFVDIHLQEPFHAIRSKISNNAKIALQETSDRSKLTVGMFSVILLMIKQSKVVSYEP